LWVFAGDEQQILEARGAIDQLRQKWESENKRGNQRIASHVNRDGDVGPPRVGF
jgi:hypothetical protein